LAISLARRSVLASQSILSASVMSDIGGLVLYLSVLVFDQPGRVTVAICHRKSPVSLGLMKKGQARRGLVSTGLFLRRKRPLAC
jgi:hypothetical protein